MSLTFSSISLCRSSRFSRVFSASSDSELPRAKTANLASISPWFEETKGRISKSFDKNEISISTYDTAWVAMVPSPFTKAEPCFPDSVLWLLENQCPDGSWARPHHHCLLRKDVLSSTLASVLALKKWELGQQHIDKGLHFLEMNFGSATDESQITPMGFEIIFPAMLDEARALSMNPSLEQSTLNDVMNLRDLELKRIYSSTTDKEAYMAYIGEGLIGKMELKDIMKYQRKNGSLFNSPSSTAAASIALSNNSRCLDYLNLVVNKFGGAVPAVYPLDIYSQLCTVDKLERLGISRYFITEIRSTLDQIYRCWVLGDEEIFMDASTCALAFKILRMNGYHVTSDTVTKVIEEQFPTSVQRGLMTNVETTLELFRASELMLHPDEKELENQNLKLRSVLEHELSSASIKSSRLNAEVKHALEYPFYAILERMATRKNIEHYNFDNTRILKTSYCLPNLGNKDFFLFSVEDFNRCQSMHREEFKEFERWFVEHKLDELEFAMDKLVYCYFTAATTLFAPEQSDARMSWAKHALIVSVADDLYDVRGSFDEKKKLIELLHLWDVDVNTQECCSNDVNIIFSAIKNLIRETADRGSKLQGRNITSHIIGIWLDCLNAFMKEVEWEEINYVPTFDEYMSNGYVSYGLGPIIKIPLYLVGPKLSEEMVNHSEYHSLFKLMSTTGRLINDVRGDERERQDGKVSGVELYIAQNGGGEMSTEAAVSEMMSSMETHRRELLKLVLEENYGSALPKPCKELFWHMSVVNQLFYKKGDGFYSKELTHVAREIIQHPIIVLDEEEVN